MVTGERVRPGVGTVVGEAVGTRVETGWAWGKLFGALVGEIPVPTYAPLMPNFDVRSIHVKNH